MAEDGGGLQEASHALEVSKLKAELVSIETKLRESQSQRAILESVISERLASERAAITQAEGMRAALRTVTGRVSDLTAERERDRLALMTLQTVNAASILNLVGSLVFHKRSRLVKVTTLWCSGNVQVGLEREKRLKETEVELAEVESFMSSASGDHVMRLEVRGLGSQESVETCPLPPLHAQKQLSTSA